MKTSTLLTLIFFVLIAVANAHAGSDKMEKEILRQVKQIQKMGEHQWNSRIQFESVRFEKKNPEQQRKHSAHIGFFKR